MKFRKGDLLHVSVGFILKDILYHGFDIYLGYVFMIIAFVGFLWELGWRLLKKKPIDGRDMFYNTVGTLFQVLIDVFKLFF